MATQKPSDFVEVQLTAAGTALAPVRVSNGHFSYLFATGSSVRVLTSEWSRILSQETRGGRGLFQIAPAVTSTPATSPATTSAGASTATPAPAQPAAPKANPKKQQQEDQLKQLQQQEAVLEQEIAQEGN